MKRAILLVALTFVIAACSTGAPSVTATAPTGTSVATSQAQLPSSSASASASSSVAPNATYVSVLALLATAPTSGSFLSWSRSGDNILGSLQIMDKSRGAPASYAFSAQVVGDQVQFTFNDAGSPYSSGRGTFPADPQISRFAVTWTSSIGPDFIAYEPGTSAQWDLLVAKINATP